MVDIDPQEFGRVQAESIALRREVDRLIDAMNTMNNSLVLITNQLSEARGSYKTIMALAGVSSILGSGATIAAAKALKIFI